MDIDYESYMLTEYPETMAEYPEVMGEYPQSMGVDFNQILKAAEESLKQQIATEVTQNKDVQKYAQQAAEKTTAQKMADQIQKNLPIILISGAVLAFLAIRGTRL